MALKIEYLDKEKLKPYANNAKIHTAEQIEQIKKSIQQFGFNDPIAVWRENEIVEGHGRLLAVMEMPTIETVPVIRLDNLTDEQRRAYMLAHNKLTMNSGFDFGLLEIELENIENINMEDFGFDIDVFDMEDIPDHFGISTNENDYFTTKLTFPVNKRKQISAYLRKHKTDIQQEIEEKACK